MSRTRDLVIANDALYQLSYRPIRSYTLSKKGAVSSETLQYTGSEDPQTQSANLGVDRDRWLCEGYAASE